MATFHAPSSPILLHLILLIIALRRGAFSTDVQLCPISSCQQLSGLDLPVLPVLFPFHFTMMPDATGDDPPIPVDCVSPGFDLSCSNRSETILTLPGSGPFSVRSIDYTTQSLLLNDPDSCLPRRLLDFSLSGSPFRPEFMRKFTLLNCSSDEAVSFAQASMPELKKIPCMSDGGLGGFTVTSVQTMMYNRLGHTCGVVGNITVPVMLPYISDLNEDVKIMWDLPDCKRCVDLGMFCELQNGCSRESPRTDLPRSAKYGIIIGIGIPGLLFILGITSYAFSSIRDYLRRRNRVVSTGSGFRMTISPPSPVMTGLDRPTIESYPKTMLGASRRLPKASDNTCPICLSEYEAKETLRTIPECNHYFHAKCIDEWLKMNGTCPLCRNSPEGSA